MTASTKCVQRPLVSAGEIMCSGPAPLFLEVLIVPYAAPSIELPAVGYRGRREPHTDFVFSLRLLSPDITLCG